MKKHFFTKKRTMTKVLLLAVLCLCSSAIKADDMVLQVWLADGQTMSINLSEEPRTTYSDGNLVIMTTKTTVTFPLEKVKKFTYRDASNGINQPNVVKAAFSADGETLSFSDLKSGTTILLYNVAGQLLRSVTPDSGNRAVVSVSQLPTGVYVVKMNDATYKITKR